VVAGIILKMDLRDNFYHIGCTTDFSSHDAKIMQADGVQNRQMLFVRCRLKQKERTDFCRIDSLFIFLGIQMLPRRCQLQT
jgi:hypothetical protein